MHSPQLAVGLASEYDKEQFLTLRYPAVLPRGSSFLHFPSIIKLLMRGAFIEEIYSFSYLFQVNTCIQTWSEGTVI